MKKSTQILLHVLFWLAFGAIVDLLVIAARHGGGGPSNETIITTVLSFLILPGGLAYGMAYQFLFPRFVQKKRYGQLALWGAITVVGAVGLGVLLMVLLKGKDSMFHSGWESFIGEVLTMAIVVFGTGVCGLIIRGFVEGYSSMKMREQLQEKNHQMEMALVKAQLDPHFLFNTINNVDVLIEKSPQQASTYLNKLSDILRFMLFETRPDRIPLSKEVEYIEKYIELQRLRTSNPQYVKFTVEGDLSQHSIAPMLLIPFIENAFKHATNKRVENAITISLTVEDKVLKFICQNDLGERVPTGEHNGLGNSLITQRLNLLYPGTHTLEAGRKNDVYSVALMVNL